MDALSEALRALFVGQDVVAELERVRLYGRSDQHRAVLLHPAETAARRTRRPGPVSGRHIVDDRDPVGALEVDGDLAELVLEGELTQVLGLLIAVKRYLVLAGWEACGR